MSGSRSRVRGRRRSRSRSSRSRNRSSGKLNALEVLAVATRCFTNAHRRHKHQSWSCEKLHALQVLTLAIWEIQKLVKTVMANRNEDTDKNIGKHISRLARSPEFFGAKFQGRGFLKLLRFFNTSDLLSWPSCFLPTPWSLTQPFCHPPGASDHSPVCQACPPQWEGPVMWSLPWRQLPATLIS